MGTSGVNWVVSSRGDEGTAITTDGYCGEALAGGNKTTSANCKETRLSPGKGAVLSASSSDSMETETDARAEASTEYRSVSDHTESRTRKSARQIKFSRSIRFFTFFSRSKLKKKIGRTSGIRQEECFLRDHMNPRSELAVTGCPAQAPATLSSDRLSGRCPLGIEVDFRLWRF